MSEEDDALRELAANRGCKLTKSRRRKPGGDFGRYGLKDAKTGRAVFGIEDDGLTATADEIRSFLRGGAASSWRSSLGKAEPKRAEPPARRAAAKPAPAAPARPKPREPEPKKVSRPAPPPEPQLIIRDAKDRDLPAITALIVGLGYEVAQADVKRRLRTSQKAGQHVLVAEKGEVIGVVTTAATQVLHRPRPVGRISLLVVAQEARGGGAGTALVAEAAARLKASGCGLLEVTSNMKRLRAHGFYERLGFERTSYRFVKSLVD